MHFFKSKQTMTNAIMSEVDIRLQWSDYQPINALWEVLTDKATPGIELAMAIIMHPRCGIEFISPVAGIYANENEHALAQKTPLNTAVLAERNDLIEALIVAGADPNACNGKGTTSIMIAASKGYVPAIELLVKYGADPRLTDEQGRTALHSPFLSGEVINSLACHGADLEAIDRNGKSPMYMAAGNGNVSAIEALIRLGGNLNKEDGYGKTPLHLAARGGSPDAIKMLLCYGADLDVMDYRGWTPLHCAAFDHENYFVENYFVMKALVDEGASLTVVDDDGITPLGAFNVDTYHRSLSDKEIASIKALLTPKATPKPT